MWWSLNNVSLPPNRSRPSFLAPRNMSLYMTKVAMQM